MNNTISISTDFCSHRVFDQDNNGYITRDELKKAMEILCEDVTEAQVSEMLALADLDKDGRIDYGGEFNSNLNGIHKMPDEFLT